MQARNTHAHLQANPDLLRAETVLELAYYYPVSRGVSVHPDIQYVIHPGMDPALDNAIVIGLRVKLEI